MAKTVRRRRTKREVAEDRLFEARAAVEIEQLQLALTQLQEAKSIAQVTAEEDADWVPLGKAATARERDASSLDEVRGETRALAEAPTGRAVIRTLQKYTVGPRGLQLVVSQCEDDDLIREIRRQWAVDSVRMKQRRNEQESIRRAARDGEVFLRIFDSGGEFNYRFLEPEHIRDSAGDSKFTQGIETEDDDVVKITRFAWTPDQKTDYIPAEDVQFWKCEVDDTLIRGLPLLWILCTPIKRYDQWLTYRMALNKARAAIVLVREFESASPTSIRTLRSSMKFKDVTDQNNETVQAETFRPGSILDTSRGVNYRFEAPNVQAQDVQHDGRAVLLQIAAGASIGEHHVTGDVSEVNYSSIMVAEGSSVMEFQLWQGDASDFWAPVATRWLQHRIKIGKLPEDANDVLLSFKGPRVVARRQLDEARGNEIKLAHGVLSVETWQEQDGLDPIEERERVQRNPEQDEIPGAIYPHNAGGGDGSSKSATGGSDGKVAQGTAAAA
jgi:hypothetical protein